MILENDLKIHVFLAAVESAMAAAAVSAVALQFTDPALASVTSMIYASSLSCPWFSGKNGTHYKQARETIHYGYKIVFWPTCKNKFFYFTIAKKCNYIFSMLS